MRCACVAHRCKALAEAVIMSLCPCARPAIGDGAIELQRPEVPSYPPSGAGRGTLPSFVSGFTSSHDLQALQQNGPCPQIPVLHVGRSLPSCGAARLGATHGVRWGKRLSNEPTVRSSRVKRKRVGGNRKDKQSELVNAKRQEICADMYIDMCIDICINSTHRHVHSYVHGHV